MAYFYEIRSPNNTVLRRTNGFPDREAATEAARADAKKLRAVRGWRSLWGGFEFSGGPRSSLSSVGSFEKSIRHVVVL